MAPARTEPSKSSSTPLRAARITSRGLGRLHRYSPEGFSGPGTVLNPAEMVSYSHRVYREYVEPLVGVARNQDPSGWTRWLKIRRGQCRGGRYLLEQSPVRFVKLDPWVVRVIRSVPIHAHVDEVVAPDANGEDVNQIGPPSDRGRRATERR
jgi:hypothetical protein